MNLMDMSSRQVVPVASASESAGESTVGIRDLVLALARRWRLAFSIGIAVFALAFVIQIVQQPKYTARASILINPRQENVVAEDQALSRGTPNSAAVDSETEVLRSRGLLERLVQRDRLAEDEFWNSYLQPKGIIGQLKDVIRSSLTPPKPETIDRTDRINDRLVNRVENAISVRRRAVSFVIDVSATTSDPVKSADLANSLVDLYFESGLEARTESGERASGWLAERMTELRLNVQRTEAEAEAYRSSSGLLSSSGVSLTEQQTTDLQTSVIEARADLAEAEARYEQVQNLIDSGSAPDSIAGVLSSNVIRDLRAREADLVRRQTELESTLGELHPSVQSGRAELTNVRGQIYAEVGRIAQNLRNEVEVSESRLRALENNLTGLRTELVQDNVSQVRLRELEREAAAARTVYERFLERFHEVSDQGRLAPAEARVISAARPPASPSSPKLSIALVIAMGIGVVLAFATVIFIEVLDSSVRSADEIEQRLNVPVLVSIPTVANKAMRYTSPSERHPAGYLLERPISAYAEALRVLRSSIMHSALDRCGRVIAITSALPAEGKTTTSLALARTFANAGESVILVECDIRRKSLNVLLQLEPTKGLLEVLQGEADLASVVDRDEQSSVHILPVASQQSFSPRDMFGSEAMRNLIETLRATYDVVLLDCAPVLAVADVRDLVAGADLTIVVARWGKTSSRALAAALRQLAIHGGVILGVALNNVNPRVPGRSSYSEALYYGSVGESYYRA